MKSDLVDVCLGYYDFEKFVVLLGVQPTPIFSLVSSQHEFLHHQLNISSGYGQLMHQLAKDNSEATMTARSEACLRFLADKCEIVHGGGGGSHLKY